MIYAIRLYLVDVSRAPEFTAAFRVGGLWCELAHLVAGHIHTDLLSDPSEPSKFMSIEFWISFQAFVAAKRSSEVRSFARWLGRQTVTCEEVGMFACVPQPSTDLFLPNEVRCAAGGQIQIGPDYGPLQTGKKIRP